MEKIIFKNEYLNVIAGALLVVFAILGYFLNWIEDFLPIIYAVILILLSTKRFVYSFKKIVSKNATLILIIEYVLDVAAMGLLIYLGDYVEVFVGLIIYFRGFAYLLINYVATRKVDLGRYILNIFFLTLGAFFMFFSIDSTLIITIFIFVVILVFGAVYLQYGVRTIVKNEELEEEKEKEEKEKEKIEKLEEKTGKKIDKLEKKVKENEEEQQKILKEKQEVESKLKQKVLPQEKKPDYATWTVAELKVLAKQKGLVGVSSLSKAQLVEKLKETK